MKLPITLCVHGVVSVRCRKIDGLRRVVRGTCSSPSRDTPCQGQIHVHMFNFPLYAIRYNPIPTLLKSKPSYAVMSCLSAKIRVFNCRFIAAGAFPSALAVPFLPGRPPTQVLRGGLAWGPNSTSTFSRRLSSGALDHLLLFPLPLYFTPCTSPLSVAFSIYPHKVSCILCMCIYI